MSPLFLYKRGVFVKNFFKKFWHRIISIFCALLIAFSTILYSYPVLAVASGVASVVAVVGVIGSIKEFCETCQWVWDIVESVIDEVKSSNAIQQEYYRSYWSEIVSKGQLTESKFREYWTFVVMNGDDTSMEAQYPGFSDTYTMLIETVASGLSLDSLCDSLFSGNGQYAVDEDNNPVVSASTYKKDVIDYWSEYYKPHENASQYIWSYQSTNSTSDDKINFTPYVPIYMDANGSWGKKNWSSVYVLPFYIDDDKGTDTFYNKYYVHIYSERVDGTLKYYHDMYDVTSGNLVSSLSSNWDIATFPYLSILIRDFGQYYPIGFKGYDRYMGNNIDGHLSPYIKFGDFMGGKFTDGGTYQQVNGLSTLTPKTNKNDDYGYILSSEPFELIANQTKIDYNQIPDNYTITINGDTIYDYDITNPDTGDHGTVNYYITNNYTLPDNGTNDDDNNDDPGSGSGSSSGTVSGNVTVGGKVDVSGKIEIDTKPIDININVNGGGSGSSGTADVPDIPGGVEFDQDVSLNNYYDWMQEQTTGFSGFMKNFFSWLPEPIVIMLCAGFALVILARFLGR